MKEAQQNNTTISIPSELIIAKNGITHLAKSHEYNLEKSDLLVVTGGTKTHQMALRILDQINIDKKHCKFVKCSGNRFEDIAALEKDALSTNIDYIVGIGGGLTIDTAKIIGTRKKCPVILIPTVLSSDAICSPIARVVITAMEDGGKPPKRTKSLSIYVDMPKCVIIDIEILKSSPVQYNIAGVGDLISNNIANLDWRLAEEKSGARIDTIASVMATNAVESFLNVLGGDKLTDKSILALAQSLVMSGLAMAVAGSSRPCSGGEHIISHCMDHIYDNGLALHGVQVALGTIFCQYLHEHYNHMHVPRLAEYKQIFQKIGLPTHYGQLNLNEEDFVKIVRTSINEFKKPGRYTILDMLGDDPAQIQRFVSEAFD